MKKFNYLLLLILQLVGCSQNDSNEMQNSQDEIIGTWTEISPCEFCNTLNISRDTIFLKNKSDERTYKMLYRFELKNHIHVTRLWEIEEDKRSTRHEIKFLTDGTLILQQFMPVDFGITGFEDITLSKTN